MQDQRGQRLPFDSDIDWWVNCAEGDLGASGTHAAVVAQLERGGPGQSSGTNPDHMTDHHLRAVRRYRRVELVWVKLASPVRRVLRCYYEHRQLTQGMREELGRLAGVAFMHANDAEDHHVADACAKLHQKPTSWRETEPGRIANQVVNSARDKALNAAMVAHAALEAARGGDASDWAPRLSTGGVSA